MTDPQTKWKWLPDQPGPPPILGPPAPPPPPDPRIAGETANRLRVTETYRPLIDSANEVVSSSGRYLRHWDLTADYDSWFEEDRLIDACVEIERLEALLKPNITTRAYRFLLSLLPRQVN